MRLPFGIGLSLTAAATLAALAPLTANGAGRALSLRDAFGGGEADACVAQPGEPLRPIALNTCFYRSAVRASRAAGHNVGFETRTDASPETAAAYAAAALAAAQAIVDIADGPGGKSALAQVTGVAVDQGPAPAVRLSGGVLTVTIAPFRGDAGRPSVFEIAQAVRAGRLSPT